MITPPRRAVTRFFVPFIDVLILLFGIFLLMPFVSGNPAAETAEPPKAEPKEALPTDVRELQRRVAEAESRLVRMEKAGQARVTDRLMVRVLHTDRKDGTLYYFDPDRQEIRTEADAQRLIKRQEALAMKGGGVKDLFFLILQPEKQLGFPTKEQVAQIHHWFREVPHEIQ